LIPRYEHVGQLIETTFEKYAALPAYTCLGKTLTFRQLDEKSRQFAAFLQNELQLKPGDRLAIQLPNVLQFPIALYGAMRCGVVVVNVNPLYKPREIKHQVNDSGAKVLVVLANVAFNAAEIIDETSIEHVIVTELGDEHDAPKRQIINFVCKYIKKIVPRFHFKSRRAWRSIFANDYGDMQAVDLTKDSLLVLQYTGGTTGISKGAMLTHGNIASNVWQMITHMPPAFDQGKETFVACLPFYHIYALNLHGMAAFSAGAHNIMIPNPRDLDSIVSALKGIQFTIFIGINTLFRALVRCDNGFDRLDFSKLKITSAGGMALTEDAALGWEKITGCKVIEGYGLTETSPVLTGNPHDDIRIGTIGKPLPETEIKILDDEGIAVAFGQPGEICARGPQVMPGYWHRPDETAKVMTSDGFFKTGDIAVEMEDGYYKIIDRKKDIILVSGFNVYPNEVEEVLALHPNIVEAAAVGVPDEMSGEIIKVFIVPETTSLTEAEVLSYSRKNLTAYKVPKLVEFRSELPKSNVGKILRRELRD